MKAFRIHLFATALLGFGLTAAGCHETNNDFSVPYTEPEEFTGELVAFPGAEGFGRYTTGGRGGDVYHVTTLEDGEGKGTFRYAVNQAGARTIVFDVAGTIQLASPLHISNGNLTIAGQSAPGDGICIGGAGVTLGASNIIIRYVRFRPGNSYIDPSTNEIAEFDGLGGMDLKDIIIDHCSVSWSVDECLSVYGSENTTVQWCIASEALHNAGHSKGAHGYGGNWGGARASYHHNLIAHCASRVPRLGPRVGTQTREHMDLRNNVFYNWAGNGCYGGEGMKVNMVNNYYKPGPATALASENVRHRIAAIGVRTFEYCHNKDGQTGEILPDSPNDWFPMQHVWGKYYIDGNVMAGHDAVTRDNWTEGVLAQTQNGPGVDNTYTEATRDTIRLQAPLDTDQVTTHSADEAFRLVVAYAGCAKKHDAVDARILQETREGTATYGTYKEMKGDKVVRDFTGKGLINKPEDVGGYPELKATKEEIAALKDTDGDGMPDEWEVAHGLHPKADGDGRIKTLSPEGYTNLEVYLNGLVEDITARQNKP